MAQVPTGGNYVVDNSTGANVRADINEIYDAILTMNSGGSAPSYAKSYTFWADTTAGIMKMRNGANNAFINLFTLAGGIDVDAASNFNEDVTFTGASANIVFDKSDSSLEFADTARAKFGTGADLHIHHNGTDTFISNDTGDLVLNNIGGNSDDIFIRSADDIELQVQSSENAIKCIGNGAVELYFDNTKKFESYSHGIRTTQNIDIQGSAYLGDSGIAYFGDSQDLQIYHDGTHSRVVDNGTGNLILQGSIVNMQNVAGTENMVKATQNNGVELFYDNATILETESWGVMVTGTVEADQFNLLDSNGTTQQIRIGASGDMRLFHQSNENIIGVNTVGQDIFFKSSSSSALDTTSFVVRTDGSVTHPDNIRMKFGTGDDLQIYHDGSASYILENGTGVLNIKTNGTAIDLTKTPAENLARFIVDGQVELYFDNTERFATKSDGVIVGGKYRQKTAGGTPVYAQQIFRESIAANTTKTFTITGLAYGNVKITMGFGDGNFHYAAFAAVLGGNMFSSGNAYAAHQMLNDRSGVNSITVTKSNSSYAIAIHAGTNQIFGSVVLESNNYDTNSGATLTIS